MVLGSSRRSNAASRNNFSYAVSERHHVCKNFGGAIARFAHSWLRSWWGALVCTDHLSFLQRFFTTLEYWPQVISTRTGVVATWSLGENHPTLWLIVSSSENHLTLGLMVSVSLGWQSPDVMVRVSFWFPCWCFGGLGALFGWA